MQRVVYSVITGDYDRAYEPRFKKTPNVDYLLFTNNKKIKSDFWEVVYLNNPVDSDFSLQNRQIKIMPFDRLHGYEKSIYIDGHIEIKQCLGDLFDLYEDYDWVGPEHRHGGNIIEEAFRCFEASKLGYEELKNFILVNGNLNLDGVPFPECGFILREHNENVKEFSKLWLDLYTKGPRRDQLHWQLSYLKNSINFSYFSFRYIDENQFIELKHHRGYIKNYIYKRFKKLLRELLFK